MSVPNTSVSVLLREYGPILNTDQIASVLGYRTVYALQKAIQRDQVPFPVRRLPGRRGWYANAVHVAAWMDHTFSDDKSEAPR